jgi:hypothetical protein
MNNLGRSQDAYDRFCAAVEVPLLVLAVFWLHRRLDRIEALLTRSLAADQPVPPAAGAQDEEHPPDREAQSALPP